jgi:hypothetical protein
LADFTLAEPSGRAAMAAAAVVKRIALLPRCSRLQLVELVKPTTDRPAVTYLGEGESLRYLARLHGATDETATPTAVVLTRVRQLMRKRSADSLWYIEVNRLLAPILPHGAFTSHPWIVQKVPLSRDGKPRSSGALEGVFGRKVRKHGLSYRLSTDPNVVASFYREYYLPYHRWRFGDAAHIRSEREFQAATASGFLLQVTKNERWLSGIVCRVHKDEVVALAYGVAVPYEEHLHMGAVSAASYFLIRWAESRGFRWANFLRSRPHLNDGLFEHKRRLGALPSWDPWPHTTIAVLPPAQTPLPPVAGGILVRVGSGAVSLQQALERSHSERSERPA